MRKLVGETASPVKSGSLCQAALKVRGSRGHYFSSSVSLHYFVDLAEKAHFLPVLEKENLVLKTKKGKH